MVLFIQNIKQTYNSVLILLIYVAEWMGRSTKALNQTKGEEDFT